MPGRAAIILLLAAGKLPKHDFFLKTGPKRANALSLKLIVMAIGLLTERQRQRNTLELERFLCDLRSLLAH